MNKNEKGFFLFFDWINTLRELPAEDAINVIFAISEYNKSGADPTENFSGALKCVVNLMYNQIKRAEKISEIRAISGQKGAFAKANNTFAKAKQEQNAATNTYTNTNTDTDTDTNNKEYTPPISPSKESDSRYADRFVRWWSAYPRKVGKGAAEKAFLKLNPSEELTEQMIAAVTAQRATAQWQRDGGQYIPNPSTWLNQERWRDEVMSCSDRYRQTEDEAEREYQEAIRRLGFEEEEDHDGICKYDT